MKKEYLRANKGKFMTKESNAFKANVPFLCPLKTSENLWFSDAFMGYRNGKLAQNGLIMRL